MNKKTMQRAFDLALMTIRKQGRASMDWGGCCYRGDEDCRCAIGALINDEYYFDYLEGQTADDDIVLLALARSGWPTQGKTYKAFYLRLQRAHDYPMSVPDCDFLHEFEKNMAAVAKDYGLDYHE